jgi:hypothetical protein
MDRIEDDGLRLRARWAGGRAGSQWAEAAGGDHSY